MYSLGLGGSNHDFSACLVRDGAVVAAVEEERLTRRKYSVGTNALLNQGWRYCLETAGIGLDDLDAVVFDDTLLPSASFHFRSRSTVIRHHLAHAASAFLPSPFAAAAVLVTDGGGSLVEGQGVETMTTYSATGTSMTELTKVYGVNWTTDGRRGDRIYQAGDCDNSLGFMYKAVSREIGFALYEEGDWYLTEDGKTMGLSAYGGDRYVDSFRQHLDLLADGRFELHLRDGGLLTTIEGALDGLDGDERMARAADLAFAAQTILEETVIHAARELHRQTGQRTLCLAGGVMLNCVANGKLLRAVPFDDVYVQPAAGDAGCALGSALYGYHVLAGRPRESAGRAGTRWLRHAYLGRTYDRQESLRAVAAHQLPHATIDDPARAAAERLAEGALVGWFTGGSEFGPRALGHRSILADPRAAEMKDVLNAKVKHREWFRPFAPAVLAEHAAEYFDLTVESPFMLIVAPVRPDKQGVVPAIVHVDGTARVQTLTPEANGSFHTLVSAFNELTAVPVVLNTSFNDRGEPIVETPEEAVRFFAGSLLDYLFIDDVVIAHDQQTLDQVTRTERQTSR
jgi:carbamoyltransferase